MQRPKTPPDFRSYIQEDMLKALNEEKGIMPTQKYPI